MRPRLRNITAITTAGLVVLGASATRTSAATSTANLNVSVTVVNNCTISTTPLAFGTYDTLSSADTDATGTVEITCTQGATATIGLDLGANASASTRRMKDATTNHLTYEIYNESTRTTIWNATNVVNAGSAPSNAPRSFTAYGRIAGAQSVPAGSYSDTVVATVDF